LANQIAIEILQMEGGKAREYVNHRSHRSRTRKTQQKILIRPGKCHSRPAHDTTRHLLEIPEEPAMPRMRKPREIVFAHVDLLNERRFGIYESPLLHSSMHLFSTALRIDDV